MSGKDHVTAILAGKKQLGLCPMVKLRRVEKPTTIVLENINGTHDRDYGCSCVELVKLIPFVQKNIATC